MSEVEIIFVISAVYVAPSVMKWSITTTVLRQAIRRAMDYIARIQDNDMNSTLYGDVQLSHLRLLCRYSA